MTATLVAILVQDGYLAWNTTLSSALPSYKIHSSLRNVTVELLTSHRSGIASDEDDIKFLLSLYNISAASGRDVVTKRMLSKSPALSQGAFFYDNINYMLVGTIIDSVTQCSSEELLITRLFKPLGITTAGFGPNPQSSNASVDNPWPHVASPAGPVPLEGPALDSPPV